MMPAIRTIVVFPNHIRKFIRAIIPRTVILNEKGLVLWAILNALAVFTCSAIAVIKPVQDWWYYVGAAICMGGSFIPALKLIDILNLMATRPLPSCFGREGANHGIND